MSAERPINADEPPPEPSEAPAAAKPEPAAPTAESLPAPAASEAPKSTIEAPKPKAPAPTPRKRKRRRQPLPLTPKLLAGLVLVAIAFIVAAVIGGSGGSKSATGSSAPAPTPVATSDSGEAPASATAEQLGYPSFATNNTTRIGGSDAAANAAAVALAVFPGTEPSQRPKAVTLVSEENWAGAVAASVLMAEPVRAPLLVSSSEGAPNGTNEAFEALQPSGFDGDHGVEAFSLGSLDVPGEAKTREIGGGGAAAQAAEIAKLRDRLFGSAPAHVVVAPNADPEIAVPAAAWAARSGDPVLFTDADALPAVTAAALKRHNQVPVYVLGPDTAIADSVLAEIAKVDEHVKRVSGKEPVSNAIAFARYHDGDFGWNVNDPGHGFVLARTDSPIDAAVASPLSASGTWGPLLLTDSATKLPEELRNYFLDVKPGYTTDPTRAFYNHVWVIGDQEAIDVNQQAEVNGLAELAKIGGTEK